MKFVYCTLLFLFIFGGFAFGQGHLGRFIGKDSSAVASAKHGTKMDSSFFITRIGGQHLALSQAILARGVTPYDYGGSLSNALKAARDSNWVLILPPGYSTDSTFTFDGSSADSVIEVLDFRGQQFYLYSKLFRFQGGSVYFQRNSTTQDPMILLAVMSGTTPVQVYGLYIDNDDNDQLKIKDATGNVEMVTFRKDGYVRRNEAPYYDAVAWFPPSLYGADLDTIDLREEVYLFDGTTNEQLFLKMRLPDWFTSMDSVEVIVSATSTAGDSVSFQISYYARTFGEPTGGGLSNTLADTVDLGTSANTSTRLKISGTFSNLSAGDEVIWRLLRDTSIPNNESGDVIFHGAVFYFK